MIYPLTGNHLHRDTVKRRSLKGAVKRRPLADDLMPAGMPRFRTHRYSLFQGVPAAHCLARRFADLEEYNVSSCTVWKQQGIIGGRKFICQRILFSG